MRKPARRKCAHCREWFHPAREGQVVCSFECASAIGKKQTAKAREAANARAVKRQRESEKEGRQRRKARLAELRPNGYYKAQAQKAFNAYIRARDAGLPCISCGTFDTVQWEAGHYRSRGKASHLRYNEDNISKQCHHCNVQLSGNQQQYRLGLIKKIGPVRVEALENNNTPHRYTIEELEAIRKHYSALRRQLVKTREAA